MLEIGNKVKYVRRTKDEEIAEGTGILKGLGLDHENRLIALVRDGETVFNVPTQCLDRDDDFPAKYQEFVSTVLQLSKEGNERSQSIVNEYNARIKEMHDDFLGKPLELNEVEKLFASNDGEKAEAA